MTTNPNRFPAHELAPRLSILKRTWKLMERPLDDDVLEGALTATAGMPLPQLSAACADVTKSDVKGPLLRAILSRVDRQSYIEARDRASKGVRVLPPMPGPLSADQMTRLERHARPASDAIWTDWERVDIAEDVGCRVPAMVAARVAGIYPPNWIDRGPGTMTGYGPDELIDRIIARNGATVAGPSR